MLASEELKNKWKQSSGYGDLAALSQSIGLEKTGLSQIMNGKRGTTRAKLAKIEKWINKHF